MLGYQRRRCPIVLVGTSGGDVFLLGFRVRSVVHYQEMAGVVQTLLNKSRLEQGGAYVREDTVPVCSARTRSCLHCVSYCSLCSLLTVFESVSNSPTRT
jgi:hypothetical protein